MIFERLLLVLPLLAITAMTLWAVRGKSPLEPSLLLVVATAIIGTYYPIGASLVKPLTWRHGAHLPEEVLLATQMQYLVFGLGACFIVSGVRLRRASSRAPSERAQGRRVDHAATELRDLVIAGH